MTSERDSTLDAILKLGGDPADLPFWQACDQGLFLVHQCQRCRRCYWPASRCVEHGDEAMAWVEASGQATLHTYTIMHRSYVPTMKEAVPFVVGVVELEEGPLFHTNIVNCDHDKLKIGMALQCEMQRHDSGLMIPLFFPRT